MFHAAAFAEQDILVIGDVAGGVNARLAGLEILIHYHAVASLDAAGGKKIDGRVHADAGNHHVAGDFLPVRQHDGTDGAGAAKLADRRLHDELHTPGFVVTVEEGGHLGREDLRKEAGLAHDHCDLDAFLGEHRSHLHADEPTADDGRALRLYRLIANAFGIGERAQVEDAREISAG